MSITKFIHSPSKQKNTEVGSVRERKKTASHLAKEKEFIIINDKFYRTFVIGDPLNPPEDCTTEYENQMEREKLMKNQTELFEYNSSDMSSSTYRDPSLTSWAKGESLSVTSTDVLEMIFRNKNDKK